MRLATSVGWLIAARALQGAGAALVVPLAMALLGAAFPREERGRALGIFSGGTGLALIAGPVVGGAIAQGLPWQWIFWINLPIAVIVIPLAARRIDESFGPSVTLDIPGIALVTGSALGLAGGLMRANSVGWSSLEIIATLGAGLLLAAAFVGWELRAREPMVPMRFFCSNAFASGIASSFFFYASMYGVLFFLPQFLQIAQGLGPFEAGVRLLPWTATLFVVAPFAGKLVNRVGERPLVVIGLVLQAFGMAWIGMIVAPDLSYMQLVAPLVLTGAGVSMAMPVAQNAVLSSIAASEIGKASGTFNMLRYLGGVFGIATLAAVFARAGNFHSAQAFSRDFAMAIGASASLSIIAAIAGLWLPRAAGQSIAAIMHCETPFPPCAVIRQTEHKPSAGQGFRRINRRFKNDIERSASSSSEQRRVACRAEETAGARKGADQTARSSQCRATAPANGEN